VVTDESIVPEGCVRWDPELSPEGEAYAERLRAEITPRIRLLVRIRKALGMTQVEAARELSMTQAGFSKQERRQPQGVMAIKALAESRGARLCIGLKLADGSYVDLSDAVAAIDPPAILDEITAE
jgi:hypothetical protein